MKRGIFIHHQQWTDIVNILPLIDYYLLKYTDLTVIARPEARNIYESYLMGKDGVDLIYQYNKNFLSVLNKYNTDEYDYLFHGKFDGYRVDRYRNSFMSEPIPFKVHFNKRMYICYDIDASVKIDYFNFNRNFECEKMVYDEFIEQHGSEYILFHDNGLGDHSMEFEKNNDFKYINLDGMANDMFSLIKVISSAKEIHLVDSVWASFCYMVDAKFGILNDVYIYPFNNRWGGLLKDKKYKDQKLEPVELKNWKIIY